MRTTSTLLALILATPSLAAASDPAAVALAEEVMAALGGREAWDAAHHIRFRFAGARTHHWDKWSGDHRLEGTTRDGVRYVVLQNIDTRKGRVWLDGVEATGEAAAEWLERGYGAWINDTYWLLVPYKLLDPGVNLVRLDDAAIDGTTWQVLELTFGEVGLTPGDRYRIYIHPETKLVGRWDYVLEDYEPGQAATAWVWDGWQRYGGIMLASGRRKVEGDRELPLGDLAVLEEVAPSVYTDPAPVGN